MTKAQYDRDRYLANREKVKERAAAWAKANAEKRREIVRRSNEKRKLARHNWHQMNTLGRLVPLTECSICGTSEGGPKNLVVHHKDGDRTNNDPENHTVLCRACHVRVHRVWGLGAVGETT